MSSRVAEGAAAPKQRVFLSAADLSAAKIGKIRHPRTLAPLSVALCKASEDNAMLLEIQRFSEPAASEPRSWLIAGGMERVQQDGALFLATPIDPLFLLLRACGAPRRGADRPAGYYKPMSELSDAVVDGGDEHEAAAFEACVLSGFSQAALLKRLRAVCDVNDKYDEPMVRLSDAKLLSWLRRKVTAVQAKLQSDVKLQGTAAQKSAAAHSAQFDTIVGVDVAPTGSAAGGDSTQAALEIAVTLVCEYLEPEVSATLCTAFTVPEALLSAQRGPEEGRRAQARRRPPPPRRPLVGG